MHRRGHYFNNCNVFIRTFKNWFRQKRARKVRLLEMLFPVPIIFKKKSLTNDFLKHLLSTNKNKISQPKYHHMTSPTRLWPNVT